MRMAEGGESYNGSLLPQDMNDEQWNKFLEEKFDEYKKQSEKRSFAPECPVDPDVYDFNYKNRGLAMIFNNTNFKRPGEAFETESLCLAGNRFDEQNLTVMLEHLGFDVLVCFNFTAKRMSLAAKKAAKFYNHHDADCFMCVIITHGDWVQNGEGILYGCDLYSLYIKSIVEIFNDDNCKGLMDKPRLFFIQSCRGIKEDEGVAVPPRAPRMHVQADESEDIKLYEVVPSITPSPLYPDCLIMYGTCAGYKAFGNTETGSQFVSELSLLFSNDSLGMISFLRGLTAVCKEVAMKDILVDEVNGIKVPEKYIKIMPVIDTMLTKDIKMTMKVPFYRKDIKISKTGSNDKTKKKKDD